MKSTIFTLLFVALLARACPEGPRRTHSSADIEQMARHVERMEVRDTGGTVLSTVTDGAVIRGFLAQLPPSEFDDIFQESGTPEYEIELFGGGRVNVVYWVSKTHLHYPGKGSVKLRPSERTAILDSLSLTAK